MKRLCTIVTFTIAGFCACNQVFAAVNLEKPGQSITHVVSGSEGNLHSTLTVSGNTNEPWRVEEFTVRGIPNVVVRTITGNIKVQTADTDKVRIELFVTRRGLNILSSDRLGDDYRMVFRQRHQEVVAEVISLKGAAWSPNAPVFNFVVTVPKRSHISVNSQNGDIEIAQIDGNIDVRTASGRILLENTRGNSRLSSTSGDILVQSHNGVVFSHALSGNVLYENVNGESRIKVTAGDVTMRNVGGNIAVQTVNGHIDVDVRQLDTLIDLESVVGDIRTNLPSTAKMTLNAVAQAVNVNNLNNFDGEVRRASMIGHLNGGGIPIRIRSRVGTIEIDLNK